MDFRSQKKVSSACSYCRARKRKCSVTMPCENCVANHKICEYGNVLDGRRRESVQRARIDSAFHKKLLQSLLDKLRQGNDDGLATMIRNSVSLEDLAAYLVVDSTQDCQPDEQSDDGVSKGESWRAEEDDLETLWRSFNTLFPKPRIAVPASGVVEVYPHAPSSTTSTTAVSDIILQDYQDTDSRLPRYMIQPLNIPASYLSVTNLLTNFCESSRHAISLGTSEDIILGSPKVNLNTALNKCPDYSAMTPSAWISELLQRYESLDVYVRLSFIYFVHQYLRWVISPAEGTYRLLPECMKPTLSQCLIPHHAAIDICHLPALRTILLRRDQANLTSYEDREYIVFMQLAGMRTNWHGGWDRAVVYDHHLGHHTLSDEFIDAASKVEEWTAGRILLDKFPDLLGTMHFAQQDVIPIDSRQLSDVTLSGS